MFPNDFPGIACTMAVFPQLKLLPFLFFPFVKVFVDACLKVDSCFRLKHDLEEDSRNPLTDLLNRQTFNDNKAKIKNATGN